MKLKHAVPAALLLVSSGLLAGCGSDDDETASKNIKASILKEEVAGAELSDDQAGCLSDEIVAEIGVDQLKEYGLLNDDLKVDEQLTDAKLEAEDADAMATAFVDCVDAEKLIEEQFSAAASGMTPEQQECIKEALDEDAVKTILSATFQGNQDEIPAEIRDSFTACVTPAG